MTPPLDQSASQRPMQPTPESANVLQPIHADPALEAPCIASGAQSVLSIGDDLDDSASAHGDVNRGFVAVEPDRAVLEAQMRRVSAASKCLPLDLRPAARRRVTRSELGDACRIERCLGWLSELPRANPFRLTDETLA